MTKTLNEFFQSYESTRLLLSNLETNMLVYCDDMPKEDWESLMRTNLIMIRQCLEDFGAE